MFILLETLVDIAPLEVILNANVAGNCEYPKQYFIGKNAPEMM